MSGPLFKPVQSPSLTHTGLPFTYLMRRPTDDFGHDGDRLGGSLSGIAAVGERFGDKGERVPRQTQDDRGAISILNVRGLRLQDQTAPVGVE